MERLFTPLPYQARCVPIQPSLSFLLLNAYLSPLRDQIVVELHLLLETAKVKSPYVLVGWSFGGWIVQAYAKKYPQATTGIVCSYPTRFTYLYELQHNPFPSRFLWIH